MQTCTRLVHWQVGTFTNLPLLAVILASALFQLLLPLIPFARDRFDLGLTSASDTLRCLALGLIPVTVLEVRKLLRGRRGYSGSGH